MNYRFTAMSGSLRKGSYNTSVLNFLKANAPENVEIEILSIAGLPLYDQDIQDTEGFPPAVQRMAQAIKESDGLIIVSPEYNYSIPGGLKNAIDWVSRSLIKPFEYKPVGVMGASTGMLGTARMQYHLRQVMVFVNAFVMNKPEVMISQAQTKINEQGDLTDEKTREFLKVFIDSFCRFTDRVGAK